MSVVLVRAYPGDRSNSPRVRSARNIPSQALPPVSAYAFADILRSADSPEFQLAIDGIAEICAKNRMSLADEYSSHLPPLGEITATSSVDVRPHLLRPGMRTALTSVPEASSGSSEGTHSSKKRKSGLFGSRRYQDQQTHLLPRVRIASTGRTVPIPATTVMAGSIVLPHSLEATARHFTFEGRAAQESRQALRPSHAESSLQRLLAQRCNPRPA